MSPKDFAQRRPAGTPPEPASTEIEVPLEDLSPAAIAARARSSPVVIGERAPIPRRGPRKRPAWGVTILALLLFGGLGGYAIYSGKHALRSTGAGADLKPGDQKVDPTGEAIVWHSVSTLRRGLIDVGFTERRRMPLSGKAADQGVQTPASCLILFTRIRNVGAEPVEFRSWHTLDREAAQLTDNTGRTYELADVSAVEAAKRHVDSAQIAGGQTVQTIVAFLLPADLPDDEIESFRIELSAEAVGAAGAYRFELLAAAIEDF